MNLDENIHNLCSLFSTLINYYKNIAVFDK